MPSVKVMKGPTLYPADRALSKKWFVKYYDHQKKSYQKVYGNLNRLTTLEERMAEGARLVASIMEADAMAKDPARQDQLTLLVQQFYDFKCMGKKNKSVITYRSQVEEFVRWYRVERGSQYELQILGSMFLSFLAKNGRSNTTINNYRSNLSSIFRQIVKAKKLAMNPFEFTQKQKERRQTNDWFRPEQIDELRMHFSSTDPQVWLACRMQFYCFIRPCEEMRSIRIGDLQLHEKRIRIRAGVGKSATRDEYVPIPDLLLQELEQYLHYPAHYYLFGANGIPASKPLSRDGMSRRHNSALRNKNYPNSFSFYSWKNTGAVSMLKNGISILHISRLMRHKSLDYTNEYFKSLGFDDVQNDLNRLMPVL